VTIAGVLGQVLLPCGILLSVFQIGRLPAVLRWPALIGCAGIGFGAREYLGGFIGDLSITTQILLAGAIVKQVLRVDILDARERSSVLAAAAVAGLVLYPLSSGVSGVDLYSLGFHSFGLMFGLALAAVISWYFRPGVAAIIPLGVIAFNLRLLSSTNVWDYLLDPALTLFAWGWVLIALMRRVAIPQAAKETSAR
jgi:hypothetical protein